MSDENPLKAYTFHGLSLKAFGENAQGDCPFCDKENHFFVKIKTNQYNCRKCGSEGNLFTFLQRLHEASLTRSTVKNAALQKLSAERNIPISEFQAWGLAVSIIDGSFLLPQYNTKCKLANLSRVFKINNKWNVFGTPTCKVHPFGTNLLQKQQKTLWVTEGPWDGMALSAALKDVRQDGSRWIAHSGNEIAYKLQGVISVPGATTFAPEWLQHFLDRDVRLVFDNDHPIQNASSQKKLQPGWDGMHRIIRIASEENHSANKIRILVWGKGGFDANLKSGYDVRDLLKENSSPKALTFLTSHLSTDKLAAQKKAESNGYAAPPIEPLDCKTFDELCEHFAKHLYFPESMRSVLTIALTTVCSTRLDGEQLWFRIIGPPGSGKTTIAECMSAAREYCFPKSIMTGWHSGMAANRAQGRKEPSLVPLMNGKCVIIKDADTLLSAGNRDKILAELRDIYDGSSRAHYRTGKQQDFENLRTTFLLCGTDALRSLNRTFLGERFLDCDILGDSATDEYLESAMASAFTSVRGSLTKSSEARDSEALILKRVTYGFILTLSQRIASGDIRIPTASAKVMEQLKAMAQLLSFSRARVERDREEIMYRPRAELATRLIKQFAKLATCIALVLDKPAIDNEVMAIVHKVLHDTACGFPYECIKFLYAHPKGRATYQIALELGLAETTIRRVMDDMQELGIVTRRVESNNSGVGGRNLHLWYLSTEVRELVKVSLIPFLK